MGPEAKKKLFRSALGRFATGVTVVSVKTDSKPRGMTANAFSSVSLDPPLVLVCVDHRAATLALIRAAKCFGVSMLAADQKPASDWFAGKGRDAEDQFADFPHVIGDNGCPLLKGSLATLECKLHEELGGGDHSIFVGEVTRIVVDDSDDVPDPLLFYASAYRRMDLETTVE